MRNIRRHPNLHRLAIWLVPVGLGLMLVLRPRPRRTRPLGLAPNGAAVSQPQNIERLTVSDVIIRPEKEQLVGIEEDLDSLTPWTERRPQPETTCGGGICASRRCCRADRSARLQVARGAKAGVRADRRPLRVRQQPRLLPLVQVAARKHSP